MFKPKFNDKKFKTNVRLCINRLKEWDGLFPNEKLALLPCICLLTHEKLVEKKKTEMALKARKEIADYIKIGKAGKFSF